MSHGRSPDSVGLSWRTAGESHGPALLALLEGLPAGLAVDLAAVQEGLRRRWLAYGRGPRAKFEEDRVECLAGLKRGVTLGSPLALLIHNSDRRIDELPNLAAPRPGHGDLPGALRLRSRDLRAVLERASARETAARVALGEVARQLLARFRIEACAYVTAIGGVSVPAVPAEQRALLAVRAASAFFAGAADVDSAWRARIEAAAAAGDSLGGVFEVQVWGCPPGLGGTAQHSDRLDARLMAALASLPAVKGVEIGIGFRAAELPGSEVHDEIVLDPDGWAGLGRVSNRMGGVEGGYSNGQPIRLRAAMKPIPTMRRGAGSVRLDRLEPGRATYERSDVCAVPAASVAAEAVILLEVASALRARLGGASLAEMARRGLDLGRAERPSDWPEDIAGLGGHAS